MKICLTNLFIVQKVFPEAQAEPRVDKHGSWVKEVGRTLGLSLVQAKQGKRRCAVLSRLKVD